MIATRPYRNRGSHGMGLAMEQPPNQASRAGGAIIAFTVIAGALIGNHYGQPSLGTVVGTAIGVAISLALYIHDRIRGG